MLAHRLRRWTSITPTWVRRPMFAVYEARAPRIRPTDNNPRAPDHAGDRVHYPQRAAN